MTAPVANVRRPSAGSDLAADVMLGLARLVQRETQESETQAAREAA